MAFGAPSNGVSTNSSDVEFDQATANWGTVTHFGILDASTSGNLLYHGALTASKVIDDGDVFKFASAAVSVTLA
jgi:hypothetical protein